MLEILTAIYAAFTVSMGALFGQTVYEWMVKPTDTAGHKTRSRVVCVLIGIFIALLLIKHGWPVYQVLVIKEFT